MSPTGYISVHIQPFHCPGRADVSIRVPMNVSMVREAWEAVDYPSADAGVADVIEVDRERIIRGVLSVMEDALRKSMESNDTLMGYSKDTEE